MINHLCWNGVDEAERLLRSTVPARAPGDEEVGDDNRPRPRGRAGRRPGDDRGRLPDRGLAPAGGRDPQLHPELDQGGQDHLPQERARADGHAARRAGRRAPALPPRRRRGGGPLGRHPDGPARVAGAALPHRPARVRQHREGVPDGRRLPRALPAHRLPAAQPRPARRQGGRPLPRLAHRGPLARVQGDARRHPPPAQLVHPLGRHPRLHPPQRPRGRLQPQVRGPRPGPARVPVHRPALQELVLLAGHPARAVGRARRPRRAADHRAQLEPARGPPRLRLLRQVQEPLPRQHRHASASAWPRSPTRSPRSTPRSSAPTRSSTARGAASSTCTRRWASSSRRWSARASGPYWLPAFSGVGFSNNEFRWSPRIQREDGLLRLVPGPRHARRRPAGRRLPGARRPRPAGAAREPDARRGAALLAQEGRRHQPRDRRLRDGRPARAARAARRRDAARCAR